MPIYSLTTPPQAPRKKTPKKLPKCRLDSIPKLVLPEQEDWEILLSLGGVRWKYAQYTPRDIKNCEDKDFLQFIVNAYYPSSQPHTHIEAAYLSLMKQAAEEKLLTL